MQTAARHDTPKFSADDHTKPRKVAGVVLHSSSTIQQDQPEFVAEQVPSGALASGQRWMRRIRSIPRRAGSLSVRVGVTVFRWLPEGVRNRLIGQMSASPLFAAVYYLLTGEYRREQQATFAGRLAHLAAQSTGSQEELRYGLRRSIHRIEKGLIMRPRRRLFAESYIEETVDCYSSIVHHSNVNVDDTLLQWTGDVLREYFQIVEAVPAVDRARKRFDSVQTRRVLHKVARVPYQRDLSKLNISYDDMLQLAHRRRSVRWYRPDPVPRELIDRAIEVARWSPSACNRQPFIFRIFDEPDLVQQIAEIPMGAVGFAQNIPVLAVLIGQLRAFPHSRDRHLIYIDSGLAAMAFEFALEVQGLSSCSINWPDIPELEARLADLLGLAPDERPVMLISLGYPDEDGLVPWSEKKSVPELRTFNETL